MNSESAIEELIFHYLVYEIYKSKYYLHSIESQNKSLWKLGPMLQNMFHKWSGFCEDERQLLNYLMMRRFPKEVSNLYFHLMKCFHYWEFIQDNQGACGFTENPFTDMEISLSDEEQLLSVMRMVNTIAIQYSTRLKLNKEICQFDFSKLKDHTSVRKFGAGDESLNI